MRRRMERRFQDARERLGAGNMNNAKWRDVFDLLRMQQVRIKFLDEAQPRQVPSFSGIAEESWCDSNVGAFAYREIEWLEVIGDGSRSLLNELQSAGHRLPLIAQSNGFRLQAYGTST